MSLSFSIWVNVNHIFLSKKDYINTIFVANFALMIFGLDKSPLDKCPTTELGQEGGGGDEIEYGEMYIILPWMHGRRVVWGGAWVTSPPPPGFSYPMLFVLKGIMVWLMTPNVQIHCYITLKVDFFFKSGPDPHRIFQRGPGGGDRFFLRAT